MKPFHEMTRVEFIEQVRSLYYAQPKADWETLAVGSIILLKGRGWRITRIPPKRGFLLATNTITGEAEKLLRSKYDSQDLLLSDEAMLALLQTSHEEEIKKAVAAGVPIRPVIQYDYPAIFTPYPASWDEKKRQKAHDLWRRINEMRAFLERSEGPDWQYGRVEVLIAQAQEGIVHWEEHRAEVEAGVGIKKPETIPGIVARINQTISDLREQIEILKHLRKHIRKTVPKGSKS